MRQIPSRTGRRGRLACVANVHHVMLYGLLGAVALAPECSIAWAQSHETKPVFDTVIRRNWGPGVSDDDAGAGIAAATPTAGDVGQTGGQTGLSGFHRKSKPAPGSAGSEKTQPVEVRQARVSEMGGKTRFEMALTSGVRAEIFTLANPYRVIVDLPDVLFRLPDGTGQTGAGLISTYRYGLFADRKGRVVLDATGPVKIEAARMTSSGREGAVTLQMELVAISANEFGVGTGATSSAAAPPVARPSVFDDRLQAKSASSKKPLILIDPGHGGIDPGALGVDNILEKKIVMDVAKRVERRLKATGNFRVAMTRTSDVFISLDQRVEMSQEIGADLFISLHADSLASKTYASVVRGATIYTLSERASDEQARLMAEKENASDQVAGLNSGAFSAENEEVRSILIDLMKRETSNFSTDFSNLLVARLKKSVSLSRDPQRSAAFRVLKQTHAPSVLVELGYLSNQADARLMRQASWQSKVAHSIVSAIDGFFDKRSVRSAR